jgi:6-phosphogluconate dehydrogenase-like protein
MAAGHHVTGWNRTREKATPLIAAGMVFADTPRAVAAGSEIVFSIVTDATAVKAVALGPDGIISGLKPQRAGRGRIGGMAQPLPPRPTALPLTRRRRCVERAADALC